MLELNLKKNMEKVRPAPNLLDSWADFVVAYIIYKLIISPNIFTSKNNILCGAFFGNTQPLDPAQAIFALLCGYLLDEFDSKCEESIQLKASGMDLGFRQ
jgi:hypothetical protein